MVRLAFVLGVCLFAVNGFAEEKLVPIFDGKTLNGWEQCNGSAKFTVEGGAIVGTAVPKSPNSFLCTKESYGDFILEFESKNDPALNSGVQLRSHKYEKQTAVYTENQGRKKKVHEAGRVHGYQVEISTQASGNSGGIFDEARRGWLNDISKDPVKRRAFKDNQWNKFRVVAIGDSIKTWVNGFLCTDLVDSMDQEGFIALQVHAFGGAKPAQVRFRNIRIQDLGRHKWERIWDGKTMEGWEPNGGGEWSVQDGALHGVNTKAGPRGFLLSEDEYRDFTVRLKYKVLKGNSGFFFRMADPDEGAAGAKGYEVEIDPTRDAGGLLEPGGRNWLVKPDPKKVAEYYKAGDWNELTASAHGRHIVVHVNGTKTAEITVDPGRLEGFFGLQLNPQDVEVLFKDIEVLRPAKK